MGGEGGWHNETDRQTETESVEIVILEKVMTVKQSLLRIVVPRTARIL